ncbi:nucleoside deaminase [Nonomuraea deserti]|uniref:Nucleoside deaminase n=1 Tax=Nonomuraea deserti TaxID=1848322 RepID=A0A4R4UH51_9ACTN|nr:nucleoside deaminase [Nonomuraea deserti]TDC89396.1 nucleoside deaminase [Nonomuraea deserti]
MIDSTDLPHLRRCVELAGQALEEGDEPFGSVLVSGDGAVLAEDHNRVASGDRTRHPEFELARWSAANMTPRERAAATVYTSGEHCPMCAAAHAWVGLGRNEVAPGVTVEGPVPELADEVRELHRRCYARS